MNGKAGVVFVGLCTLMIGAAVSGEAQTPDACALYSAAIASIIPDSATAPMVVYDSVSLATPSFAFHAWTGRGLPKADSKVPMTDSLWQQMRAAHREGREGLPACFGQGRAIRRVPYESLMAPFKNRETGWDDFRSAFPGARGFYIFGEPLFIGTDGTEALLYVAQAGHWLAGSGRVLYLQRVQGRWQVSASHALWMS